MPTKTKTFLPLLGAMIIGLAVTDASARPALTIDVDSGSVLAEHEKDRPWYPASVTKLMTAMVALDAVRLGHLTMTSDVRFSAHAVSTPPSKLGVAPGTSITLEQALRIMLTRSMNDVAVAIAETVAGTEADFARLMNLKAAALGMRGTRFANASGLHDPTQVSTAADLAILARHLVLDFPEHAGLFGVASVSYGNRVLRNTNGLVGRYPGIRGLKTGYTCASGFNLVGYAARDGRRVISVVLGAPSAKQREADSTRILDAAFSAAPVGETIRSGSHDPEAATDLRNYSCGKTLRETAGTTRITGRVPVPAPRPVRTWMTGGTLEEYANR
jgi:D-alanyl-D-alanine carboxypeptidase